VTNLAQLPPAALTPWQMVMTADRVVQAVMVLLLLASLATWSLLIAKTIEYVTARRNVRAALRVVREAPGLPDTVPGIVARRLVAEAMAEVHLSADLPPEGVKERIELRLHRIEHQAGRHLTRGTGLLASIGSCGPFVGLFGTVWGIMNSFVGISQAQTTNLAVVAPGIAEALLATATGLAAAIPAVLTYNFFARALGGYRAILGDLSAMVLAHAAREIDRQHANGISPASGVTAFRRAAE
jgi:biopolymer transport protein ExbB